LTVVHRPQYQFIPSIANVKLELTNLKSRPRWFCQVYIFFKRLSLFRLRAMTAFTPEKFEHDYFRVCSKTKEKLQIHQNAGYSLKIRGSIVSIQQHIYNIAKRSQQMLPCYPSMHLKRQ